MANIPVQEAFNLDMEAVTKATRVTDEGVNAQLTQLLSNDAYLNTRIEQNVIASDDQPENQAYGGLWLDTSGTQPEPGGEWGVTVANATVSDTEPTEHTDLWFNTGINA